jgi:putative hydrolase of HD superfamily
METKNKQTRELLSGNNHSIIELFFDFAQLKNLYRQGWLKRGVSRLDCESVADHSFGVALLGYVIAQEYRPDLDARKVMQLGLFHEIGEIYAGDITPRDGVSLEDKFEGEYSSVKKVFSTLSNPDKYLAIWMEQEKKETVEAKFVGQIDKLEMILQANLYQKLNYSNLDEFFSSVKEYINLPELRDIVNSIISK